MDTNKKRDGRGREKGGSTIDCTDRREVIDYTHLLKFPQVLCSDSQTDVAESILLTNPLTVHVVVLLLASFLPNLLTF